MHVRKGRRGGGRSEGGYGGISGEDEGNADYRGMVQPSQQHVAPCVRVVAWGLGTRAFWAGISVEVTLEAGVVPRCRQAAIETPF